MATQHGGAEARADQASPLALLPGQLEALMRLPQQMLELQARVSELEAWPRDTQPSCRGGGGTEPAATVPATAAIMLQGGSQHRTAVAGIAAPAAVAPVPMAATRVVMHQLVLPADVNQLGICTGGQVLSWIDLCAGLSAKTLARGPCVTASVDAVHFLRPCRLGCVVIIAAMVSRTFNTSMEVAVVLESEDMRTGVRHHCCSAFLTFVATPAPAAAAGATPARQGGAAGAAPTAAALPRVAPTTPEHRALFEGAEARRQQRLQQRTRLRSDPRLLEAERTCRLQPITHREGGPTLPPAITLQLLPPRPSQQAARASDDGSSCHSSAMPQPWAWMESLDGRPGPAAHHPTALPGQAAVPLAAAGTGPGAPAPAASRPEGGRAQVTDSAVRTSTSGRPPAGPHANAAAAAAAAAAAFLPKVPQQHQQYAGSVQQRQLVPPSCTAAYMTQSILPQHANTLQITFGGQVMSWIEQCAYISASRLRAPACLTAAMDSVAFVRPTRVGDILYITAQVTAIFGSSLEVMASVFGESPFDLAHHTGGSSTAGTSHGGSGSDAIFHCADAFVTVVAVDVTHGSPVQVPFALDPQEPADKLRYEGALARRAERLHMRSTFVAQERTRVSLDGVKAYSPPPPEESAFAADGSGDAHAVASGVGAAGSSAAV